MLPARFHRGGEQREVRNRGKGPGQAELVAVAGIGAGALTGNDIHQLQLVAQRAGGADADDVVHIIEVEKLPAVYADGRHTHAGGHNGDGDAFPGAGVALNAADIVHQNRVGEKILRNEFGTERIAGHEHGLCDILFPCGNVGSGNGHSISLLK